MRQMRGSPPAGQRIEFDPARRRPVMRVETGPGVARMLLDRAFGSAAPDEPSQDFLVVEHAPSQLCFAITDGVGSSFFGDLAAAFLARRTVDWLSTLEGRATRREARGRTHRPSARSRGRGERARRFSRARLGLDALHGRCARASAVLRQRGDARLRPGRLAQPRHRVPRRGVARRWATPRTAPRRGL